MQKASYNSLSDNDRTTASDIADIILASLSQSTINQIIDHPTFIEDSDEDEAFMNEYKDARVDAFMDIYGFELDAETAEEYEDIIDAADELVLEKILS
jgi:hypothetical protein